MSKKILSDRAPLAFLLIAVLVCYAPGLSGSFLLDDYSTLSNLAQWGEMNSVDKLKHYVNSGFSGPTGRPIALLSFALSSDSWPGNPEVFIATNIAIHLINVILVYLLATELFRANARFSYNDSLKAGLLVAAIWGLHPYLASSVLYIVQRMTLLSAGFSFLSLYLYLCARKQLFANNVKRGWFFLCLGGLASIAAIFSKENAVLIPAQLLLIELYLYWSRQDRPAAKSYYLIVAMVSIATAIVLFKLIEYSAPYLEAMVYDDGEGQSRREFTFAERLMTEARVVGDYITALLIPKVQTSGVFHDGYVISKSLLSPSSTLLWFLLHLLVICISLSIRWRAPIIALGVMWFYVGHLIESSVVMLELKFEHRNYLSSVSVAFILTYGLFILRIKAWLRVVLVCSIVGSLSLMLFLRSDLWGQPEKASLTWINENPNSTRALENAALVLSKQPNRYELVSELLRQAADKSPDDPIVYIKYINFTCPDYVDWPDVRERIMHSKVNWQTYAVLSETLELAGSGRCNIIGLEEYRALLESILLNEKYQRTGVPKLVRELRARAALVFGQPEVAILLYKAEIEKGVPLSMAMRYALWLASYEQQEAASKILSDSLRKNGASDLYLYKQALDMKTKIDADI